MRNRHSHFSFLLCLFTFIGLPVLAQDCKPLAIVDSLDLQRLPSGRPAITVKISGSPKIMLIDTGGAISGVTQETAKSLNLVQTRTNRGLKAVNGERTDTLARLPTLEIGQRLKQENALFYVLPNSSSEFDGILSGEFLKQYDADFDFGAHKLNLFSQDHCAGKVVYWQSPVVATVPFTLDQGNHIILSMELDGKKLDATLDTGASNTALNLTVAQRTYNVDVNATDVQKAGEITGGFSANVYRKTFKSLTAGAVNISDPVVALVPDLFAGATSQAPSTGSLISDNKGRLPDLLLGMTTLSQLHVYVAYKERKLYITASAAPPPPPQAAPAAQPAQTAQTSDGAFCPSPASQPDAATLAANPSLGDGMAAFRNKNYSVAYANFRPLSDKGNTEAARQIGIMLRQSCGRSGDKAAAAAWLQKAADAGDIIGAAQLGDMYEYGDGVSKDAPAAFKWLSLAANAGQHVAQADLGELYFTGTGVAQDRYQGVVWSVRAGEDGRPLALFRIGREYANGQALPKDNAKAVLYMTAGIQRLPPGRRPEFQPALDSLSKQMSADAVSQARQNAQKWMPGMGSLAEVQADADKKHGP